MGHYLLRSLAVAGFFSFLVVAAAGSPAKAGSLNGAYHGYGSQGLYTEAGWRGKRYRGRHYGKHRFSRRHFRRDGVRRYQPRRHHFRQRSHRHRHYRHRYNPGVAFGLGVLGGTILSQPYSNSYVSRSRGYCHVHRYRVPGMTFHRDVRCFKHRHWTHPSIVYVR